MSEESKLQLITTVRDFALHGTRHPLRDFQHIAGYLNWALNVYPYHRPGLCALYAKTAGKLFQKALLWVNRDVERELTWIVDHLLRSVTWSEDDHSSTVLHVYCDGFTLCHGVLVPISRTGLPSASSSDLCPTRRIHLPSRVPLRLCSHPRRSTLASHQTSVLLCSQTTSILSSSSIRSQHYLHSTGC